ncbi:crotonase/enoyl-CoA hydratase family protein [Maritimibacter sp. DP07]|uniref:Crotonase/enoyl-CoA hydratase family protein n=1 Tax=Maritimibacter harenae TaxID=2606218 RepID=A0A845M7K1_9RHOB|nr:crotonase/enoyl-CoA hydratase family protein [Maritimibacter harenae]MZR12181.1 crotonase/enoyl-CoA hydratase family protein [Maritimibacter harenae]
MSVGNTVLTERDGAVLVVKLNRPERRNAIDRATSEAVAHVMDEFDADETLSCAILTGVGNHFCAGMDLKAFLDGERVELEGRGLAGIIQTPPRKPVIAAVEGYALAGGFEIALACDLIVASEEARFGLPEVRRGLIAGSGGLLRLPERIPRQIAMECALTGRMIPAEEAARWGLVNRLCSASGALDEARDLAREIAVNAPMALAASKEIVAKSGRWPAGEVWPRMNERLEKIINSQDAREGAAAFAEKRAPCWRGR